MRQIGTQTMVESANRAALDSNSFFWDDSQPFCRKHANIIQHNILRAMELYSNRLQFSSEQSMILGFFLPFLTFLISFGSVSAQVPLWQGYGISEDSQSSTGIPGLSENVLVIDPTVPRFFLLKSGLMLEASGAKSETHYEVKAEFGSMLVPIENVEFIGESREQIWQHKKRQVDPANCTQLMKLAEWCFSNNFQKEGLEQYHLALKVVPNDQLAGFIRQRIAAAETQSASFGEKMNMPESGIHVAELPDDDPEWTRWVNGVPSSVFDTFSKKVQPILVQRCASAACHGSSGENQYKINIPRQSGGRTTNMNLRSSVQWIDTENPSNSPLLSALVTSHAGKKALFSVESDQYHNFIEWIQLAAKELPGDLNPQLAARLKDQPQDRQDSSPHSGPSRSTLPAPIKTEALPQHLQKSLAAQETGTAAPINIMNPADYSPTRLVVPNVPVAEKPTTPKHGMIDPFDPNRFNALYHADLVKLKNETNGHSAAP